MEFHDPFNIVGTTIADKYVIEAVVGEGGFGIVYRAMHKIWQQPVAIKCFKALMEVPPAVREGLLKDFIQEGALLTQLSGRTASIVQARDVGTFTTASGAWVPYMVLEWLDGKTLEQLFEDDRARLGQGVASAWPIDKVIALLEPVAMALDVVHRRGIAHRDIKPANIFVLAHGTDEMHVKVLDFGIAKVVQSAAEQGSFTRTGGSVTSFTPAYGAPEQFSRAQGATGPWTDVYALALVMSELLIGAPPLEGDDFIQLGMASADPRRRPTPKSMGVPIDDALEDVLQKALAVRPPERYPTAGEFWQAVRASQHLPQARSTVDPRGQSWVSADGRAPAVTAQPGALARSRPLTHGATELSTATPLAAGATATSPPSATTAGRRTALVLGALGAVGLLALAGSWLSRSHQGASSADAEAARAAMAGSGAPAPPPVASAAPPLTCPQDMARIPGGKFFMGSDDKDADAVERPAHQVTLSPYCIDLHEVTTAEFKACSDIGECKRAPTEVEWPDIKPFEKRVFSPLCNAGSKDDRGRHPINCVDWDMASVYCAFSKKRLPSEAEWEFAARGPDGRRYPWGDEAPDKSRMNACGKECLVWGAKNGVEMGVRGKGMYPDDDGYPSTAPVGSFPAGTSRYGLFDVVGNVWEWTRDWEGKYSAEPASDPTGPEVGERRVVRGGAFNGAMASWVRPSQRYSDAPGAHSHAYGFRCAKSP